MKKNRLYMTFAAMLLLCGQAFSAILYQTTGENEARLVNITGDPQVSGTVITRCWPAIVADAATGKTVKELSEDLNSVTIYTNPVANGHTYTGTWVNVSVNADDENTVGSAKRSPIIVQVLHKVDTPANATQLAAITSRMTENNEILRLFSIQEGEGDTRSLMWENLPPSAEGAGTTFQNLMYNITDAQMVSTFASGWVYWRREWQDSKDGIGQFMVAFKKAAWTNSTGSSPDKVLQQEYTFQHVNYDPQNDLAGWERQIVKGGDGIPIADLEQIRDNQEADSGWFLNQISVSDNGDGSGSLRKSETKEKSASDYLYRSWKAANGRREESEAVYWSNLSSTNATLLLLDAKANSTNMALATYVAAPANHKLSGIDISPNQNGSLDVLRTTFIPRYSGGAAKASDWENFTNAYTVVALEFRRIRGATGAMQDQYRKVTQVYNVIQTEDADDAFTFINVTITGEKRKAWIEYPGASKYRGYAVTASYDTWTNGEAP